MATDNADVENKKLLRAQVIKAKWDPTRSAYNDRFEPSTTLNENTVHSTVELIKLLESDPTIELDSLVISLNNKDKTYGIKRLGRAAFIEAFKSGEKNFKGLRLKESFTDDSFATDGSRFNSGRVGDDFIPAVGGPFYKQLYQSDYIRMHNLAFWAINHDPIARAIINITRDFTLGRGFRVDSDNDAALSVWRAFEQVNDLQGMMDQVARELSTYGETMVWKLPNSATKIAQGHLYQGQKIPKGAIPRVRLIDPSVIWEIVTWPEDITKVLYYVWVSPTQYQMYTGAGKELVPASKFIYQTIPADQVRHYKINAVSNEKRGRSDLFPILGDLKRLRDAVDYQIVSLQKQAAWSIDTVVEGSQSDVDAYKAAMDELGADVPAGSEFIHTDKIKRTYTSAQGTSTQANAAFEWALSMIAAGSGIPISYFGTHISGGSTRASAIVATEPVAKKFEMRQLIYEKIIRDMWSDVMTYFGLGSVDVEVTFPEIISQDRSAKLKDLALAETEGWISKKTAATVAAKELGISEYEYDDEQEEITKDPSQLLSPPEGFNPLTSPAGASPATGGTPSPAKSSAVTSAQKKGINDNYGF